MHNFLRRLQLLTLLMACCFSLPAISGVLKKDAPILIVDESATARRTERNWLVQMGYTNIDEAPDGASALQKLRAGKYALIISIWAMEPMGGLQLLKEVRADTKLRNTPFIMVTSASSPDQITKAKEAGANNSIAKPISAQTLGQTIDSTFSAIK